MQVLHRGSAYKLSEISSEASLMAAGKWLTTEFLQAPKTDFKRNKPRTNDWNFDQSQAQLS